MTRSVQIAAALCAALLGGCLPLSLHPLYDEGHVVSDEGLLGAWTSPQEPEEGKARETWTFARSEKDKAYELLVRDAEGQEGRFVVHMVQLGAERFLDLYPKDPRSGGESVLYRLHRLPVHSFFRVRLAEGRLGLSVMRLDWLKEHLKADPGALRHEVVEDDFLVITAPTKELQAFVLKHVQTEGAYGGPAEMVRPADAPPAEGAARPVH